MFKSLILFHRRLLVLSASSLAVLALLVFQLGRLTLEQGEERLEKAKQRLHSTIYLPTWRGRIIDRKGRVIAEDVPSYAIAIDWDVITGDRAIQYAREDAKSSLGRERWQSISSEERQAYIDAYLPARLSELRDFWELVATTGGVQRKEVEKTLSQIRIEVEDMAEYVWSEQEKVHKKRYGDVMDFVQRPIREQREPHIVLPRVSDEIAMAFEMLSEQYDHVIHIEHSRQRDYPLREQVVIIDRSTLPQPMAQDDAIEIDLDRIAELIVGDVRDDVWVEDIEKNPFRANGVINLSGYRAGDEVGFWGLEQSLEDSLRGYRGQVVRQRNGDELSRISVRGGKDVQVTLDIKLQARVEAVLSPELGLMRVQEWHRKSGLLDREKELPEGTPLRGAVVVLEIESGEVIAMASSPALDGYPWLNRAAYGLYPPGSIIKPLVLVAAMTEGELRPDESIECTGHYFEHVTDAARCWIYRSKYNYQTHGHLKPVEAIARSCNFFFYDLGTRLGLERLSDWLQKFGMSKPLAVQLTHEHDSGTQGHVPTQADINKLRKRGALKFETVSVAIGQGTLTWTPLQAAAAFATLARGGVWLSPSLVKGLHQQTEDLNLNQESVSLALQGLHDSISKPYGTGARLHSPATNNEPTFNVDSIRIWGKTGTAEAPGYLLNESSDPVYGLDHSWFVVMASTMNNPHPEFVVAVLVEHGGSGGLVAGPIANQILHALQAEGYLESTP